MPLVSGGGSGLAQPSQWSIGADGSLQIRQSPISGANILDIGEGAWSSLAADGSGTTYIYPRVDAVGLELGALAAQTQPLLRTLDTSGAESFRLDRNGYAVVKRHAAPADGDLAAGECALWFDQTNGAAKLMVKAKQADGTVKTASIALA